jgi:hypothetical protein
MKLESLVQGTLAKKRAKRIPDLQTFSKIFDRLPLNTSLTYVQRSGLDSQ